MPIGAGGLKNMAKALWVNTARAADVGGGQIGQYKLFVRAKQGALAVSAYAEVAKGEPTILTVANRNAVIIRLLGAASSGNPAVVLPITTVSGTGTTGTADMLEFVISDVEPNPNIDQESVRPAGTIPISGGVNIAVGGFLTIKGDPTASVNSTTDGGMTYLKLESTT